MIYFNRLCLLLLLCGCARSEKFPHLGDGVAIPTDIQSSQSGEYFYVLNSDADRTYNEGSILTIDGDGNKIHALFAPRQGASMSIGGPGQAFLVATFDIPDEKSSSAAILYSLQDPAKPVEITRWELPCRPLASVMARDYPYFAVSCIGGGLVIGKINPTTPRDSTTHFVREYGYNRRALHIDPVRNLLLMFVTDVGQQSLDDQALTDSKTYDNADVETPFSNEIPDDWENSKKARRNLGRRILYQYIVFDLAKAETEGFPMVYNDQTGAATYNEERRWLYFTLLNKDGSPEAAIGQTDLSGKIYQTNFWHAEPDASDADVFYLSQRGKGGTVNSNQVVRVRIKGDLRPSPTGKVPETAQVLGFERIYGFAEEINGSEYPGDFSIQRVGDQDLLAINSFKDLRFWERKEVSYSIISKSLTDNAIKNFESTDLKDSYYQLAITPSGRLLTGSYYGNQAILLDLSASTGITEVKRFQ